MIRVNRKGINYADNVLDNFLTFNSVATWAVSSGTGASSHEDTWVFEGDRALLINNTNPINDIIVTNSDQNTVIANKTGDFMLSMYLRKEEPLEQFTGEVQMFKNAVLLDTQAWTLGNNTATEDEDGVWVRFMSDTVYSLVTGDVITFKFQLNGMPTTILTQTKLWIDGLMLNNTERLDAVPPIYTPPKEDFIEINRRDVVTTYNAVDGDSIWANASGGTFTINLPQASLNEGARIYIKKIDSSINVITVDGNGADTINGSLTQTLNSQYDSMPLECDGNEWIIE